jgi:phosphatidylglycerol:prolipoprotein diacylglycerol transferase
MPFVIDIDPVALTLLGIPVRWYGLTLLAAAAVAIWLARREGRRRGIAPEVISDAVVWVAVASLVGGRTLYVIQNELGTIAADPLHVLMVWQGGLSFYGGLITGLAAIAVFARRRGIPVLLAADIAAPAAALGQAIGHFGCLISGDSFGTATSVPWAVIYRNPAAMAPQGVPLHPTQLYEALALGILFVALWRARPRLEGFGIGALAGAYLLGLSAIRFGLFFLRDEPAVFLGLKTAQWLGLGIAVLAIALLLAARRQGRGVPAEFAQLEASRP